MIAQIMKILKMQFPPVSFYFSSLLDLNVCIEYKANLWLLKNHPVWPAESTQIIQYGGIWTHDFHPSDKPGYM
jgi:hypothetical protein